MKMVGPEQSTQVNAGAKTVAALCLALALLLGARSVSAQQIPVRTCTTADGLPCDLVLLIVRDSHGFLWFCTGDGLSRFNGYEFTTYGAKRDCLIRSSTSCSRLVAESTKNPLK